MALGDPLRAPSKVGRKRPRRSHCLIPADRLAKLPHNALIGGPELNWEMGTRDTGSYATFSDVVDYLDWLGSHFTESHDLRTRIEAAGLAMKAQEAALIHVMIHGTGNQKGLAELDGTIVIGGNNNAAREGLVCLSVAGVDSEVAAEI